MMMRRDGASLAELQAVYEQDLAKLRRVAAAIVHDRDLACDVVQDAFVKAVRLRSSYRGDGSLTGWVWRIVVNVARDTQAAASRMVTTPDTSDELVDDGASTDTRRIVRAAVEQLPERQRLVLFLRVYGDLSHRGIAEAAGISEGTVAATLHAAQKRLRELLSEVPR
jgi:RNA polymerase sigma-70 factor (ECF subfamily)